MKKGFTLIEMLVVVLIIGILAAIALPQYQMAVTKAKVASILPIMRRWKDAMYEFKLQHGDYVDENGNIPDGATLGVNWPSDWKYGQTNCGDRSDCFNDYWVCNTAESGWVMCQHLLNDTVNIFEIYMYQPDDPDYINFRNKITCNAVGTKGHKICKALGGKLVGEETQEYILY